MKKQVKEKPKAVLAVKVRPLLGPKQEVVGYATSLTGREIAVMETENDGEVMLRWDRKDGAAIITTRLLLSNEAANATAVLLCNMAVKNNNTKGKK